MNRLNEFEKYLSRESMRLIKSVKTPITGEIPVIKQIETVFTQDIDLFQGLIYELDRVKVPQILKDEITSAAKKHLGYIKEALSILELSSNTTNKSSMSPQKLLDIVQSCNNQMCNFINRLEPIVEKWKIK